MKEVMEAFLGLFFFMIIITGSMSVITAAIDAKNADASKTGYIAEIENSNFSSTVLESIFKQAESEGYTVSMRVYHMLIYQIQATLIWLGYNLLLIISFIF